MLVNKSGIAQNTGFGRLDRRIGGVIPLFDGFFSDLRDG